MLRRRKKNIRNGYVAAHKGDRIVMVYDPVAASRILAIRGDHQLMADVANFIRDKEKVSI